MKPRLLQVPTQLLQSFSVRQDWIPNINNRWHVHVDVELIQFHRGTGMQFVGDNIKRFGPGDLVLVGANLPHYWRYDDDCHPDDDDAGPYSTVIHFQENFWGDTFLDIPENKPLKVMLEKARNGLLLTGQLAETVAGLMEELRVATGPRRILILLECLLAIAQTDELRILSSPGFQENLSASESERINAIYAYTLAHFGKHITLNNIASVAGMVPNSFCRYFKSRTGKTYSQFLTEIRVGAACKLLIENRLPIKQVSVDSGFNNASCFHQRFREITGKSPQAYQQAHIARQ